jgi:Na+-driven multidrug efflux pump
MRFQEWLRKFFPYFSLWLLLVLTWPLESIYLSQQGDLNAVVANQLSQLIIYPLILFTLGISQPLSWSIAKLKDENNSNTETQKLISTYLLSTIFVAIPSCILFLTAPWLAKVVTDSPEIGAEFVRVTHVRAWAIPLGYMAGIGDFICFGKAKPSLASLAVIVETVVFAAFLFFVCPLLLNMGYSAGTATSLGLCLKFLSTCIFYFVVFKKIGWIQNFQFPTFQAAFGVITKAWQNSLLSAAPESARGVSAWAIGHLPALEGTIITLTERTALLYTSFSSAQKQIMFSQGSSAEVLKKETFALTWWGFLAQTLFAVCAFLIWHFFPSVFGITEQVLPLFYAPLIIRALVSLAELVAHAALIYGVIYPSSTSFLLKPGNISLIANWFLWLPFLLVLSWNHQLNGLVYTLSLAVIPLAQIIMLLLGKMLQKK